MAVLNNLFGAVCDNLSAKLTKNSNELENKYFLLENQIANKVNLEQINIKNINTIQNIENLLKQKETLLVVKSSEISANNPINILNKGYSKVSKNEKSISKIEDLQENDTININFIDGNALAEVKKITKN